MKKSQRGSLPKQASRRGQKGRGKVDKGVSGTPQSLLEATKRRGWRAAVGVHACQEVLKVRPNSVTEAWVKKGWEHSEGLTYFYESLRRLGVVVHEKLVGFLDKVSPGHQGIVCFVDEVPDIDWGLVGQDDSEVFLGLDGIEDPHNLGAILRTSWLLGVKGVLTPSERSVGLTPTVHKVACGGVEHVPVEKCSRFSVPFEELKEKGFWIYGLSANGGRSMWETKFSSRTVLVVGAEDKGLRMTTEGLCDELVHIPQACAEGSYNASVATAMVLAEVMRQQS